MTLRAVRKRGANIVVQAYGEVLFMPGGDVANWKRRFSANAQKFAAEAAPTNKRPRWSHYGKPLKQTINRSSTRFVKARAGARLYSVVGSTAPHAYYVDQGTGVHAGNGAYAAKILPPWQRGSPSLYEHTWIAGSHPEGTSVSDAQLGEVMIRGQKGQFFLDAGLRRTFAYMRMRQRQVPTDGKISEALHTMPQGMENFLGNTPADAAFREQLEEWRRWRDAAWRGGRLLGQGYVRERYRREYRQVQKHIERGLRSEQRKIERARKSAERSKRWREERKRTQTTQTKTRKARTGFTKEREQQVEAWLRKNFTARGAEVRNVGVFEDHTWAAEVKIGGVWVPRSGRW